MVGREQLRMVSVGLAAALWLLVVSPAMAVMTIDFDSNMPGTSTESTGASARVEMTFSQVDADTVQLDLGIFNTTNSTPGTTVATLVGFGFDLSSLVDFASYDPLASEYTQTFMPAALPPFGSVDFGVRSNAGGTFVGGNPRQGLTAGQSSFARLLLNGTMGNVTALAVEASFQNGFNAPLDPLRAFARFQQVGPNQNLSDKVLGSVSSTVSSEGGVAASRVIPEPATASLSLLGLAILMMRRRRRTEG